MEELFQSSCIDSLHLVGKGVVKVAELENQLFAADVLVDANVVGARTLGSSRSDVILRDVSRVAASEQL